MTDIKAMTPELFEKARGGSWYTILGLSDVQEFIDGYQGIFDEREIGTPVQWYETTGSALNHYLKPAEDRDWFEDDLAVLMFPLDGLNVGKLAMVKLMMQDRWFDDIVANTHSRTAVQ